MNAESSIPAVSQADPAPAEASTGEPRIVPRSEHRISRKNISEEALKVLYRLSSLGFKAYLVGGGVRDLYLGKKPKDFDVGTDAKPSRLKRVFRNCRIIGRRFRIAHVFFPGEKIIEVATFRRGEVHRINKSSGVVLIDNEYGTAEEDARRRDLTINGLFYDITTHSIIDYVGGVEDLENRIIRTINDPDKSYLEDPVRMIRTLRHAVRTDFQIEENTLQAIYRNRQEIANANTSRLLEELFKDLRGGAVEPFLRKITETHLLDIILPALAEQLRKKGLDHPIWPRMSILDKWAQEGREAVNPTLLALFLQTVLLTDPAAWIGEQSHPPDVWRILMQNFAKNLQRLRISRRDAERVSQILIAHRKLVQSYQRKDLPPSLQKKPYLAEALDFLEVDFLTRGLPTDLIQEWRRKFTSVEQGRSKQSAFGAGGFVGGSRRRKRSRRPRRAGSPPSPEQPKSTGDGTGDGTGRKKKRRRRRGGKRRRRNRKQPE